MGKIRRDNQVISGRGTEDECGHCTDEYEHDITERQSEDPYAGNPHVRFYDGGKPRGFSLLELITVLVILAVMSVIAIPIFANKGDIAKAQAHDVNVKMLRNQSQAYLLAQDNVPAEGVDITSSLVTDGYIKEMPENPFGTGEYIAIMDPNGGVSISIAAPANPPKLATGMTPLIFDTNNFRNANASELSANSWYSYRPDKDQSAADRVANEKWANIRLAEGSMFVWIPRFTYKITNNGVNSKIRIRYSNGVNDDLVGGYMIHPAFNFGGTQLTGIWTAKFEASDDGSGRVQVKHAVQAWLNISVDSIFTCCRAMQVTNSVIYGISSDSNVIDTHMMKNSEWGAMAYLTEAIRDGDKVGVNGNGVFYTGCTPSPTLAYTNVTYKETSSTGNAYGIYDINGGAFDCVASYTGVGNANGASLLAAAAKYKDVLPGATSANMQTNYINTIGQTDGWALHEVMDAGSGNSVFRGYVDMQEFPYSTRPFFVRGGDYAGTSYSGIFASTQQDGQGYPHRSFRPCLTVLQ